MVPRQVTLIGRNRGSLETVDQWFEGHVKELCGRKTGRSRVAIETASSQLCAGSSKSGHPQTLMLDFGCFPTSC